MKAPDLICESEKRGARLWAEKDRLELDAPADFPDEMIELLRQHKAEVLAYLRNELNMSGGIEVTRLLAWAAEMAEQDRVLPDPVSYVEAELRIVTTARVSWYAAHYLTTISYARLQQQNGGWGRCTPEWWREREQEALKALRNLREALERTGETKQ